MAAGATRSVDPWALAERGERLQISCEIGRLRRLRGLLTSTQGVAHLELWAGSGEDGEPHLRGRVRARVRMRCERCLNAVGVEIDSHFDYTLVAADSGVARLPSAADPLVTAPGERVDLVSLMEDELILALPIVALHVDAAECAPGVRSFGAELGESPFSRLGEWWSQRGSESEE